MSERYDPQAVEGDVNRGEQYVSKRDVRILLVLVAVAAAVLWPIYQYGKRASQRTICATQLKAVSDAVGLYAEGHDAGLPPLYRAAPDGSPDLDSRGLPYTWISDVTPGMNVRATLICPAALPSEVAVQEDSATKTKSIRSTYGMFAGLGGVKTYNVDSPAVTALISETSNRGANGTYDPVPFPDGKSDGFVIGFDTGDPDPEKGKTKAVTRLAFSGTSTGTFSETAAGRHDDGNQFITAAGSLLQLKAPAARVRLGSDGYPVDFWRTPPQSARD